MQPIIYLYGINKYANLIHRFSFIKRCYIYLYIIISCSNHMYPKVLLFIICHYKWIIVYRIYSVQCYCIIVYTL